MSLWTCTLDDGVVTAIYRNPPMNYFCAEGAAELGALVESWRDPAVKAVVLLASQCKQLKSLGLNSCYNINDEAVAAVASWCSQLESLDLGHCRHITDAAAVAAVRSFAGAGGGGGGARCL